MWHARLPKFIERALLHNFQKAGPINNACYGHVSELFAHATCIKSSMQKRVLESSLQNAVIRRDKDE